MQSTWIFPTSSSTRQAPWHCLQSARLQDEPQQDQIISSLSNQTASPDFICSLVQNIWYIQDTRYQHKITPLLAQHNLRAEFASLIVKIIAMATLSFLSEGIFFL